MAGFKVQGLRFRAGLGVLGSLRAGSNSVLSAAGGHGCADKQGECSKDRLEKNTPKACQCIPQRITGLSK